MPQARTERNGETVSSDKPKPGIYRHVNAVTRRKKPSRQVRSAGPVTLDVESSFIDSIGWDGSILTVNIGGNSYWYPSDSEQFAAFAAAGSKGQFYNAEVKLRP